MEGEYKTRLGILEIKQNSVVISACHIQPYTNSAVAIHMTKRSFFETNRTPFTFTQIYYYHMWIIRSYSHQALFLFLYLNVTQMSSVIHRLQRWESALELKFVVTGDSRCPVSLFTFLVPNGVLALLNLVLMLHVTQNFDCQLYPTALTHHKLIFKIH